MSALSLSALEPHLSDRDIRILEDLERFRFLTTRQLQRLHLAVVPLGGHATISSATRGTTRILGRLEQLGVITRLARRIGGIRHGSSLIVWQLGPAGDRFLRARRGDPKRRRYEEPGRTFLSHTLAVADAAVALIEQANAGRFELLELELEPTCWRSFTSSSAATVSLKPDLLAVTADATTETHSFVEIDLGSEHLPAVLRKCRVYQRYHDTRIEQEGRGLFPAVVWVVSDPLRATRIRTAIDTDRHLASELFWIITPESMSRQLAPYPAAVIT
ncbi:replication-relaxation family protein [Microbacterium sp.]|uniref:replication-relaxation family protein n=1 Tax=Microbacterium sp. TaxID=51671 RepID=UPI0025FFBA37|nr:replication-relaxation family protein [Microbacterium sp.]MBT9605763.1 replication-relaxation family protein [Microbacterium sp.]